MSRTARRAATALALLAVPALGASAQGAHGRASPTRTSPPRTAAAITAADLRRRLFEFAADSMNGRGGGTADDRRATDYLASALRRIGVEPAGEHGDYFQSVPFVARVPDASGALVVGGRRFAMPVDFLARDTGARTRTTEGAQAVFGGAWDDTTTLLPSDSAAGRIVVVTYRDGWAPDRSRLEGRYPRAAAIAVATRDRMPADAARRMAHEERIELAGAAPAPAASYLYVSDALATALFDGRAVGTLPVGARGLTVHGAPAFREERRSGRNVVGVLRGSDPRLRGQLVALSAHSDHLPPLASPVDHDSLRAFDIVARVGGEESPVDSVSAAQWARIHALIDSMRRRRAPRLDSIRNGADDDGSGSVALLEIAESFAMARSRPPRTLLFVWHTGEELGLLGSTWFTEHPTVPLDSIVAELNIDMIGRGTATDVVREEDGRRIYGGPRHLELVGTRRLSTELGELVERANAAQPLPFRLDYHMDAPGEPHEYYCRSDHYMYARFGVPVAFFFTGGHHDYHQVTDEPAYIDYDKLARVTRLVRDVAARLAALDHRLTIDHPRSAPVGPCRQ
jgi:hypothetical protein